LHIHDNRRSGIALRGRYALPSLSNPRNPRLRVADVETVHLPECIDSECGPAQEWFVPVDVGDLIETQVDKGNELFSPD
jgi:hypothetical protein